jgi:hypothetical protein
VAVKLRLLVFSNAFKRNELQGVQGYGGHDGVTAKVRGPNAQDSITDENDLRLVHGGTFGRTRAVFRTCVAPAVATDVLRQP